MARHFLRPSLTRSMADFALGLILFSALLGSISVSESGAYPAPMRETAALSGTERQALSVIAFRPAGAEPVGGHPMQPIHTGMLALVFAALTAFNLWVWRHLRYAYVAERRKSGRG